MRTFIFSSLLCVILAAKAAFPGEDTMPYVRVSPRDPRYFERTDGNQSRTAQLLGIDRKTLRTKLLRKTKAEEAKPVLRAVPSK